VCPVWLAGSPSHPNLMVWEWLMSGLWRCRIHAPNCLPSRPCPNHRPYWPGRSGRLLSGWIVALNCEAYWGLRHRQRQGCCSFGWRLAVGSPSRPSRLPRARMVKWSAVQPWGPVWCGALPAGWRECRAWFRPTLQGCPNYPSHPPVRPVVHLYVCPAACLSDCLSEKTTVCLYEQSFVHLFGCLENQKYVQMVEHLLVCLCVRLYACLIAVAPVHQPYRHPPPECSPFCGGPERIDRSRYP